MATSKEVPFTCLELEASYHKFSKDDYALEANQTISNVLGNKTLHQQDMKLILELIVLA